MIKTGLTSMFILMLCVINSFSQQQTFPVVRQYVVVPDNVTIQTIAVQPDSPIKFEDVKLLASLSGGGSNSYLLRNIGSKPILSVTVGSSTGAVNTYGAKNGQVLIAPGQLMTPASSDPKYVKEEIVPLTDELREKLKLNSPMKSFVILMVLNVEFVDGTKFNDEKKFQELEKFVEMLADAYSSKKKN